MTTFQQLYELLTREQRRGAIVVLGLMLVGMVLETLGVGLVIPALALMTQSDVGASYPALVPLLNNLGNPTQERLVVIGLVTLVGVYAVKTSFLTFLIWWQMRFLYGFQADISQRLFDGYLRQPYTFHLQRNSAQLIANAVTEVTTLMDNALKPGFHLLTELLVLVGVTVLIVIIEPMGALLLALVLGTASFGFHGLTRNRIQRWGAARQMHDRLRIQHLQQGLGGAKEVKLLGRENQFAAKYRISNLGSAKASQLQSTVSASPRFWLELAAVIGVALLVLNGIRTGRSLEALLPTLGLFAAAAFRVMPSVNRALTAFQGLRYALPVVGTLHAELRQLQETRVPGSAQPIRFEHAVALNHVSFSYPSAEVLALEGVSLSIPRGALVGLIGGSGTGKSTLVDIVLGLLTPDSGTVEVDGVDIQTNLRGWQDQLGYVPQSIFLTDDTLRRNVAFGLADGEIDDAAVWRAIRAAQLDGFVDELARGLDSLIGERGVRLSGGQRQRIGIARALYHDPPVLVLDEATSSLDSATERGVMEAVRALRGNKTALIVAHRLSTVAHCDWLFRLEQGRIVEEGETAVLLGNAAGTGG